MKLRVSGFAFAVDHCRDTKPFQRETLRKFFWLTGANAYLDGFPNAAIPREYVSYSVAGAIVAVTSPGFDVLGFIPTNMYGHFDGFIDLPSDFAPYEDKLQIQVAGCDHPQNLESMIAPPIPPAAPLPLSVTPVQSEGLTIVSDIDDVLKKSESWNFKRLQIHTFAEKSSSWLSMPSAFRNWSFYDPKIHFHYVTDAPEMSHAHYRDSLKPYPPGTIDFRPMSLEDFTRSRYAHIERLILTFPDRKFVLLGDDSTPGQVATYRALAKRFQDQVRCVALVKASRRLDNVITPNIRQLKGVKSFLFISPKDLPRDPAILANDCEPLVLQDNMQGRAMAWLHTIRQFHFTFVSCLLIAPFRPDSRCPWDLRFDTVMYDGHRIMRESEFREDHDEL